MLLNSEKISDFLFESDYSKRNQVGIDLSVQKIEKITNNTVLVLKDETKVKSEHFKLIEPQEFFISDLEKIITGWRLIPGAYALTFNEKCTLDAYHTGFIQSRSSIYRGGAFISSPLWDPGFTTKDNFMGTTMIVTKDIFIECNARVAQFFIHENHVPTSTYNGQFQGKTNY